MMKHFKIKINSILYYLFLLLIVSGFVSCQTYRIEKSIFINKFANIDSSSFKKIKIIGIYGEEYDCLINPVNSIEGFGENGRIELKASPEAEIIIHKKSGKKAILYFDSIFLKDSILYGKTSRVTDKVETIKLNNIKDLKWIYHQRGIDFENEIDKPVMNANVRNK